MATSVLGLAANTADHQNTNPSLEEHHPIRRSSGRRRSKGCDSSQKKNKKPQRGMGVEKLERLRAQEGWKKMTEISTTNPFNMINPSSASFADPTAMMNASHVQFPKLGGFGNPGSGFGNQIYTGFHGYGDGSSFRGKNSHVTVSELSSNPNVVKYCYSDQCNAYHKKKKINGENLSLRPAEIYNVNGGDYGFLGLKTENMMISHESGTTLPLVSRLGYAVPNGKMGFDQKKGSTSSERESNTSVLMEYEFFPAMAKTDDDRTKKMMIETAFSGYSTSCYQNCIGNIGDDDESSCIDLSLKL